MSQPGSTIHPRLEPEAMAELRLIADANGKTIQAVCEEILHRALLGESYALKLAFDRAARSGILTTRR